MQRFHKVSWASALLMSFLVTACGGGGSGDDNSSAAAQPLNSANLEQASSNAQNAGFPVETGNGATDSINWFNFRRQQLGLSTLTRNAQIDAAAQAHSDYQKLNNTITHEEAAGRPGFIGITLTDRLKATNFPLPSANYAFGEVIASSFNTSGFKASEDLIDAIYHRFVIFEPMFKEVGSGFAKVDNGPTYFTTNFAAIGLSKGLRPGEVIVYPFANQEGVTRNFFSDNEAPDPVPNRNEVGYPISVHADIVSDLTVQSFSVQPRGGAPLPVQLLTGIADSHTPTSAAAIVPLDPLQSATTYDVQFVGTLDGAPISRAWAFSTR